MGTVSHRIKRAPAYDCKLGGTERACVGDADGVMTVEFWGLLTVDGFPDGAVSGNTIILEGIPVVDGNDEGFEVTADGLKVSGFDVVIGVIVVVGGALEKQSTHFNRTAQS